MALDTSWEALLDPGKATDYFEHRGHRPPLRAVSGELVATGWGLGNAWWCSEISRAIYRREGRAAFFEHAGLREQRFFDQGSTQGALIVGESVAVLVFRGTAELRDWLTNLRVAPTAWSRGGRVHEGFASALAKVWDDVAAELAHLALPVITTGHSLGGALATLAASQYAFASAYTFGAPRVGDAAFWQTLRCPVYRVVHDRDIVPTMPPRRLGYAHGGELHHIAHDGTVHLGSDADSPTAVAVRDAAERSLSDRRWFEPHEALSDHAPVNYSTQLAGADAAGHDRRRLP